MFEAVAPCAEVIEQDNVGDVELADERLGFHDPGKIGGSHAAVDHRASDAESGSINPFAAQMFVGLACEFLDDQIEPRKLLAGEAVPEHLRELSIFFRKQRQIAFGAAHISPKDHLVPLVTPVLNRFTYALPMGYTTAGRRVRAEDRTLSFPSSRRDIWSRLRSWLRSKPRC